MTTITLAKPGRHPALPVVLAGALCLMIGAVTAVEPRAALALAALAVVPLLTWAEPRVSIGVFALGLGCNLDVVEAPVHVSLPQLLALAVVAGLAVRSGRADPRVRIWAGAGWLLLLAALPSLVRAVSAISAVQGMIELLVLALVLSACVRCLVRRPDAMSTVLDLLVLGAALSVVPAVVQVILDIGPVTYRSNGLMRAYSTYRQPNSWGLYLAGVFPLAVAVAVAQRSLARSGAAAAIALGLVLCASRGAWAGALSGVLVLIAATFRWRTRTLLALAAGTFLLVAIVLLVPKEFITGRIDFADWSTRQRLLVLLTAWDGILRNPILGWGPGSFEHMLPAIARRGLVDDVVMPHNVLLEIWFQLGLLAVLCFVGLTLAYVGATFRAARRARDLRLAGLLAGTIGMLAAASFGTLFIRGVQETFVLLIALAAAHYLTGPAWPSRHDARPVPV